MGSQLATLKQTGGGGYNYEDKVGAYFLLCLLLHKLPFKADLGYIERIDLQTAAQGWLFDDFLLTLNNNGNISQVAVSVKSNYHFTEEIVSKSLLMDLWDQQTGSHSTIFDKDKDYCCLAQPPLNTALKSDLDTLLQLASEQDAATLEQSIAKPRFVSEQRRTLFNSFSCPVEFSVAAISQNILTGDLLKRFVFLQFDFEAQNSTSENLLIDWAGSALLMDDATEAIQLYEHLQGISKDLRPVGGYMELTKLLKALNKLYTLKNYPVYDHDLSKLKQLADNRLSIIKTTIGPSFEIDRSKEIGQLTDVLAKEQTCCIISPSGYGKTALAKSFINTKTTDSFIIWLNAADFDHQIEQTLSLAHPITEIINHSTKSNVVVAIDALERFYTTEQIQHLAVFLKAVLLKNETCQLLFTCISGDLDDILLKLYGHGVILNIIPVPLTNDTIDFIPLAHHIPALADLLRNEEHRKLFSNIKLLDSVSFALSTSGVSIRKEQSTETGLIDFLWKHQIEKGQSAKQLGGLVKQLAKIQADTLFMGVSSSTIDIPSSAAITPLIGNEILYEADEYLYFTHDLYGDWARYKAIQAEARQIKRYLSGLELSSPLWTKAIRLFGIYLLEKSKGKNDWGDLYHSLSENEIKEKVIKNILLEAIVFCSQAETILTENRPLLLENEGKVLKDLLEVFLLKATDVNPSVMAIIKSVPGITPAYAATFARIPNFPYWPAVLLFIYKNKEEVIVADFGHTAKIVRDWLHFTPTGFPLRKEMAEIAIELANILYEEGTYSFIHSKSAKEDSFEALLTAYPDMPDIVSSLCLKIAQRVESAKTKKERDEEPQIKSHRYFKATKWPFGPFDRIDDAFEDRILNTRALDNIIAYYPALASEILLAVFIQEPRDDYSGDYALRQMSLNSPRGWNPPFYSRGPIMDFLNMSPVEAINCYIKLVDFATEQWQRNFEHTADIPFIEITFVKGHTKKYYGNQSVYFWFRNNGAPPPLLVSILMAVEKYLTDQSDNITLITPLIQTILDTSISLAFIGLLSSLAKLRTDLFKDALKPILSIADFYRWEKNMLSPFELNLYAINLLPSSQRQEAEDWNKRPHRTKPLQDLMPFLMLEDDAFKNIYKEITTSWNEQAAPLRSVKNFDPYIDRLISFFQPENYVTLQHEGYEYYQYQEPALLSATMKPIREFLEERDAGPSAHTIYNVLEKNTPINMESVKRLHEMLGTAITKNRKPQKHLFSQIQSPLDGIFAGFLLLLKRKEIWIDEYPEYPKLIEEYTIAVVNQIKTESITTNGHSVPWSWNVFLPEVLALLWKDDDTAEIRQSIVTICINFAEEVFAKLFASISSFLPWHDKRFIELQNFALRLAVINASHRIAEPAELNQKKEELSKEFINGSLPVEPLKWSEHRLPHYNENDVEWHHYPGKHIRKNAGLDRSLLYEAYKNLPSRNLSADPAERAHIVLLWKEIFGQMLYQLGDIQPDTEDIGDYPSTFDHWILGSIPRLMIEDIDIDFFSNFCEPLIKFGYKALDWTQAYCSNILLQNLSIPDKYDRLIQEWRVVIDYIELKENWMYRWTKGTIYLPLNLYMMDERHIQYWNDDCSIFINRAKEVFTTFLQKRAILPPVMLAVFKFGQSISAKILLPQIILLANQHIIKYQEEVSKPVPPGKIRQPFYATPDLGSFLTYLWNDHKTMIRGDAELFESYKNLVIFLVSLHDPLGIELQRQLVL